MHLTSAHPREDIRVFQKECRTLAREGYDTWLVVADGLGDAIAANNVHIRDVGRADGRLNRMLRSAWKVGQAALILDGDLYHCHDPELLPVALWLKSRGRRVVFDAHEDLPKQVQAKPYLPVWARRAIGFGLTLFEAFAARTIDGIVSATPSIADRFDRHAKRGAIVRNYPLIGELDPTEISLDIDRRSVCYIGGISEVRGIVPLIEALALCRTQPRLELVGSFSEAEVRERVLRLPGWNKVEERGFLDRVGVRAALARSVAGIVTLLPAPNHVEALPIKMFEYMAAGIPVIASDFPLWRDIVEGSSCGVLVDPADPSAIAGAIDRLIADPLAAREMGAKGKRAVEAVYNWDAEKGALFGLYDRILAA